jgi:hypothetical protein
MPDTGQKLVDVSSVVVLQVSQVLKYVGQLLALRGSTVQAHEIGVISPYRKQVQKIDRQLQAKFPGVKVGSVEQFQGRVRIYSYKTWTFTMFLEVGSTPQKREGNHNLLHIY